MNLNKEMEELANNMAEKLWGMDGLNQRAFLFLVEEKLDERWQEKRNEIESNAKNFHSQYEDFKRLERPVEKMGDGEMMQDGAIGR